jgi:serine/threonine-protein kinase
MGRVYHAFDPVMERDVALKVLHPRLAARPAFRDRFVREAQSAGRLRHPNIVTIYELGEADGIPYIAMEYLEGRDLHRIIRERVPLSLRKRLDIIRPGL